MAAAIEKPAPEIPHSVEPNFRQFTGKIVDPLCREGLLLAEVEHKVAKSIAAHTHDSAYFALVLQGEIEESLRGKYVQYSPFTVAFNPLGTRHDGRVGDKGVRLFTVQIGERWFKSFREYARFEETIPEFHAGKLVWLAARLFREYREGRAASDLAVESITWEMLALAAHCGEPQEKHAPLWLTRIIDRLHSQFHQPLTMTDLAAEAGVHPVHVARVFRQFHGCNAGEYVQRLRIQLACGQLTRDDLPLSEIALTCGFADQSHMTRIFKRITGSTPSAFRELLMQASHPRSKMSILS